MREVEVIEKRYFRTQAHKFLATMITVQSKFKP